jgi:hypothetical protein
MVPVLLLVFNRPETTKLVIDAIRTAHPQRLYVAADGPRDHKAGEAQLCAEVRRLATDIDWPCEVRTLFREHNLGCRDAVSSAITRFFEQEPEGIILEDDCFPSSDFFPYCAALLERHRDDDRVMAICGSAYADIPSDFSSSYYFSYYADMWGWATWRRAWQHFDSRMERWPAFRGLGGLDALAAGRPWHSSYWTGKFDATYEQRLDTWDYAWIYTVIEQGGLACYPTRNMISNLGWGPGATHTIVSNANGHPLAKRAHTKLDFPLVHPRHFVRSFAFEQEIESVRLTLHPPNTNVVQQSLKARAVAAVRRRIGHLREQRSAF